MSNDDIEKQVKKCYADVACGFDPKGYIADKLFEKGILTLGQQAEIKKEVEAKDRAGRLLHMLFEGSHPERFAVFRESLIKDYNWLVEKIDACQDDVKQSVRKSTLQKSTAKEPKVKTPKAKELTAKECSSGESMKIKNKATSQNSIAETSVAAIQKREKEMQTKEAETNGASGVDKSKVLQYQLKDLETFATQKKRTPDIIATLVKVGNSIEYESRKYYFETYFDDGSCPPVRAPVYKKSLHNQFAKLKEKQVILEGGRYGAKIPKQDRSKNSFEIQYYDDYIPVPLDADNWKSEPKQTW